MLVLFHSIQLSFQVFLSNQGANGILLLHSWRIRKTVVNKLKPLMNYTGYLQTPTNWNYRIENIVIFLTLYSRCAWNKEAFDFIFPDPDILLPYIVFSYLSTYRLSSNPIFSTLFHIPYLPPSHLLLCEFILNINVWTWTYRLEFIP